MKGARAPAGPLINPSLPTVMIVRLLLSSNLIGPLLLLHENNYIVYFLYILKVEIIINHYKVFSCSLGMHGSCSGLRTGPEGNEIGVGKAELKREDVARSKWNVRLELNGTECRGSKRSNGEECHGSEPSLNVMDLNRMIELEVSRWIWK